MQTGAVLVAWLSVLLLPAGQAAPPPPAAAAAAAGPELVYIAEREIKIPISFNEQLRKEAALLSQFVSADEGKSWQRDSSVPPTADRFTFRAPADGVYW